MTTMTTLSRTARLAVAGVSLLLLLSVLGVLGAALFTSGTKPWFLIGFELVTLIAAVFGLLFGLGRLREGPAIGLTCIAGSVLTTALLGYIGAGKQVAGFSLLPVMGGRAVLAGVLLLIAAVAVLSRQPSRSWPDALRGVILLIVCLAGTAGLWFLIPAARGLGVPVPLKVVVGLVLALVLLGVFAAGVHKVIRAFEHGRHNAA